VVVLAVGRGETSPVAAGEEVIVGVPLAVAASADAEPLALIELADDEIEASGAVFNPQRDPSAVM